MENMLLNLAKQLDSLDEASLMALWNKYANLTSRFEPSRRWEEACLVFSLIQAKHWKNQLFNYNWSQQRQSTLKDEQPEFALDANFGANLESDLSLEAEELPEEGVSGECRVLAFKPLPERLKGEQETFDTDE